MKRQVNKLIVLLVLGCSSVAFSQENQEEIDAREAQTREVVERIHEALRPNDVPRDLDKLIDMAVTFSPEVRKARAELDAAHIEIAREVSKAHSIREASLIALTDMLKILEEEPRSLVRRTLGSDIDNIRKIEETLRSLTGLSLNRHPSFAPTPPGTPEQSSRSFLVKGTVFRNPPGIKRTPEMFSVPERLDKILGSSVGIAFEDIGLPDILEFVSETYEINFNTDIAVTEMTIPYINLINVILRDALLALADQQGDIVFVLRDYGIFVTTRDRALTIPGITIPGDIPYLDPNAPQTGGKVLGDSPVLGTIPR